MAETIRHRAERMQKKTLYEMGYKYLINNFHKFSNTEKIRIALDVYKVEKSKPLIDQSTHHHITLIAPPERVDELKNRAAAVPV